MRASLRAGINSRRAWLVGHVALAIYFAARLGANGLPALRHDWYWPRNHDESMAMLTLALSGWNPLGIGGPNAHFNDYLAGTLLAVLSQALTPLGSFWIVSFALGLGTTLAARALALVLGAGEFAGLAAGAFALFNPWVYTEVVAGHIYMIVAYAATIWLIAQVLQPSPKPLAFVAAIALTLQQLQFFLIAVLFVVVLAVRRRILLPAIAWIVLGLPAFIGIVINGHTLAQIPVPLEWERANSVLPAQAFLLGGYFAGYSAPFDLLARYAVGLVALIALIGALQHERAELRTSAVFGIVLAAVIAMGLYGPLQHILYDAFRHLRPAGAFRELYDVIALIAVGYLVLSLLAIRKVPALDYALAAAAVILLVGWAQHGPARFWVDAREVPSPTIAGPPNSRYALMPAFQPVQFKSRGSGLDPDIGARSGSLTSVNEPLAAWPESVALSRYERTDDCRDLLALSVATIVRRPWLSSDRHALAYQEIRGPVDPDDSRTACDGQLRVVPRFSLLQLPPVVSVGNQLGAGSIFFGDAAALGGPNIPLQWQAYEHPQTIEPNTDSLDPREGWIDARLIFSVEPSLGQAYGGALTTSRTAVLSVSGARAILAWVRGSLRSADGASLSKSTLGYRWIPLPPGVLGVRCHGACVVALAGDAPRGIAASAPTQSFTVLSGAALTPWLMAVEVPPGHVATLRFNERYDANWVALGIPHMVHVRLDTTVNGWILPDRQTATRVLLVQDTAAVQIVTAAAAALWLAWLLCESGVRAARHRKRSTNASTATP